MTAAPNAALQRIRGWVVGRSNGADFAVSRRCRHQFADLSNGHVDAEGCLVCPWHQSRYDVTDGRMVSGPRGMLGWHGPTPGYTQLVKAFGRVVPLRVGQVRRHGDRIDVQ
ncbi:Rieske (2Fe-2S) protein [uncultured Jatrophihabitans sp.]|uniref:Rieske (2Fe-2S) protein n=1 Tax=uncultured Jatrophihabitans sp. TaxID=1610747 RepID=UPI0035CA5467